MNLNSGKVLDDSGYSLVNGTQMQQWDWLNGLNQQWSVVPVQNVYQTTGQTNLYYNASTGKITATATLDYDYHSQYYYNTQGGVEIFDNQSGVGGNTWGYLSLSSGDVSVVATVPAYAGHTYEARSGYSLVTAYTYAQVVSGCGSLCSDWYDAYNYYAILENPQGTQDIPTFSTTEGQASTQTGTWSGSLGPEFAANPYFDAGTTRRFGSDALDANGYTLHTDSILHDCHYTDDVFKEDSSQMHASASGGNGSVNVNFYGAVNDQTSDLGTLTPGLGYNVTYSINTANSYVPAYTLDYSHKCYPAYEAYIGSQQVYGYKPTHNDPATVTVCLAGGLSVTGSTIGTVN